MANSKTLILNVDDNLANLYTRSRALRKAGYEVIEADTGSEALKLISELKPALILLDVHLPDISGIAICKQIKEDPSLSSIFVLQISATSVAYSDKIQALDSGADAYLIDPVEPEELLANVRALLRLRQAEKALSESQAALAIALEAVSMGVWSWELATGFCYWSPECYQIFRIKTFDNTLESVNNFILPEDRERIIELRNKAIADCTQYEAEFRIMRGDGEIRWISSRGRCEYSKDKNPLRMFGIVMDITERKNVEEEREKLLLREQALRAEAESANQLKDDFIATVSHELRTPLNAIIGWAKILGNSALDEATSARAIETIQRNAKVQAKLIEDILDLSRVSSGKLRVQMKPVDFSPVIITAVETMRPAANAKSIDIKLKLDSDVGSILGDIERLQQVMLNLLSNSVKFTPAGGKVFIRMEKVDGHLQITIQDTGQGIKPEFLPFVFDRFRQADAAMTRNQGGIGLGLSIVRHLVELHNGTVHAHSDGDGKGATFTVRLPLMLTRLINDKMQLTGGFSAKTESGETKNNSPVEYVHLDGLKVLIVDDDADALQLTTLLLNKCGAEVESASNATEAFELFQKYKPDILVSDLAMPNEDGYALIRKVRELKGQEGSIPAIALSAHVTFDKQSRALAEGFQIFATKPIEPNELIAAIANLTGRDVVS